MTEFTIYFVAFYKHDAPQHLVAGPFVDRGEAQEAADKLGRHVVVETTLEFSQSE